MIVKASHTFDAVITVNGQHPDGWCEFQDLLFPIKDQRGGYDNQIGILGDFSPLGKDKGDDLNRFTQAHIIGQAASKIKIIEKIEPV